MRPAPEPVYLDPDYPKALYRAGTKLKIWGRKLDMMNVASAEEEADALADGWVTRPDDVPVVKPDEELFRPVVPVGFKPQPAVMRHIGFGKFEIAYGDAAGTIEVVEGKEAAQERLKQLNDAG